MEVDAKKHIAAIMDGLVETSKLTACCFKYLLYIDACMIDETTHSISKLHSLIYNYSSIQVFL